MRQSTNVMKYVFIALAGVAFLAGFLFKDGSLGRRAAREKETPLLKQLDFQKPSDPALVGYKEIAQIKLNLDSPNALAVGSDDRLYVAGDAELVILASDGQEVSRTSLNNPARCLTVAPNGSAYLGSEDHVSELGADGMVTHDWASLGERAIITSIAATESHVFVADAGNKVVWRYTSNGELLGRFGERNMKEGKLGFIIPSPYFDIAIGDNGGLWAANSGRHSLENYTLTGELRTSWQRTSYDVDGFCGCCNPTHIAILPSGAFVTSEKGIPRVKIHDRGGDFRTVVVGPEHFREGTLIADLAVNSKAEIFVLDSDNGQIRVFVKKD